MARGELRVYLGSAPGVGKTYRMLDEGWRRRGRGADVVVGLVETHGRPYTISQLRDLEVIPRVVREYRGAQLEEMDVEAILERHPDVVLVDELAHTNVPGGIYEKRWQDVELLLESGITVITTVNIQHLESVNDVVEKIIGIAQQETIPDAVVRRAEQIELVDITPEALRRRMAHGNIYSADKIDASLSNYFRSGNLTALRELALLWLADRVEDSLQQYLLDHGISDAWETRERLIVAVTGTETDEILLRRAARISSRTSAELVAVHVVNSGGLLQGPVESSQVRDLVTELGGRYQEIVDDDVARALVAFARSERGTQIVLGASRPRSPLRPPSGVVEGVLRLARDFDVHIIAVGGERPAKNRHRRQKSTVTWRRRVTTLSVGALGLVLLTAGMVRMYSSLSLSTVFLVYLIVVLALTTWGGAVIGIAMALVASGLENYYFVPPVHTLQVARPNDVVAIVAFLLVAIGVSVVMGQFSQRSNEARRARAEAEILAKAAASVADDPTTLIPLLDSLRVVFELTSVELRERSGDGWAPVLHSGESVEESTASHLSVDDNHDLVVSGGALDAVDLRLATAFVGRLAAGLRAEGVHRDADQLRDLVQVDSMRSGLLQAVAHDLRRPVAAFEAALSASTDSDGGLSDVRRRGLVDDVSDEARRLVRLDGNLRDALALDADSVTVHARAAAMAYIVARAITQVDTSGHLLDVDLSDEMPTLRTDADLVARAIANVVDNACRYSPSGSPVRISAGVAGGSVELLVIDRGPGIPRNSQSTFLSPHRHRSDEQPRAGLGLIVATGFINLVGGQLRCEESPGGGLTVVIELPAGGGW